MTRELRWRILTLQIIATLVLAFAAGVGFWAHSYTHDQVSSQLKEQQISFPAANSPSIAALPAADAANMKQYAGQPMTTGNQARVWAENFIAVHLKGIGQGKTYDYYSGKGIAEAKTNPKQAAIDEGTANTLFKGETLRSLLNQAYAFWFIGDIALFAAIGLLLGAALVVLAFLFELLIVPKREGVVSLSERNATGRLVKAS
jgi:hypothetical protein